MRWIRRVLRWLAALAALAVLALLAFPTGRYLLRAAWEEGKILSRRRPIAALAADTMINRVTRERLRLVLDARRYAGERIGLDGRESFTTYSQLERDTLILVLSGARRDTLKAYTWWFPIVGRVPYKGFFDFKAAQAARDDLRRRGFDTYLRPASAFSTLGWFNDPLVSTTLRMDSLSLANTVIHELTHNTLFVPGHVEFNESFANFVGARGAEGFFRSRGEVRAAREVARQWEDEKQLSSFWLATARGVDSAAATHAGATSADSVARVQAIDTVYTRMRRVLLQDLAPRMPTISRAGLARMQLDNASLLAHRAYAADLWLFDEVWRRQRHDLRATIALVRRVVENAEDPFEALREWLRQPGGA